MKTYLATFKDNKNIPIVIKVQASSLEDAIRLSKSLANNLEYVDCAEYIINVNVFKIDYNIIGE